MKHLTRWLVLVAVVAVVLALTAALIYEASLQGVAASFTAPPPPPELTPPSRPLTHHPTAGQRMEPALVKALATAAPDERLDIIVEMREQVAPSSLAQRQATGLRARQQVVGALQTTAERTQAVVRAFLSAHWLAGDVTHVTPFWIFNGLAVTGARPEVVEQLATLPDVALIRLDHWRRWIDADPEARYSSFAPRLSQIEWGVRQIRADEVWNTLGISGTGVVVANLDTGVDWQHPALRASYRGYSPKGIHQHEGNWFDATNAGALYPVDGHGHGSHTMGTIVGQAGIGVAPGARWIAVRTFDNHGFAHDSWLHAGFEWLLAPNGDPNLAPQVVNNSWGSDLGTLTSFQRDIDALRAAGILAIFSAGNAGPRDSTVGSPASLPGAFAVGASDQDDEVTNFSSRGPSPWGEIRPHVVAPGVNVYSALPGGIYAESQGTSMAAPHVAGTVALMLSAQPNLNITHTAHVLTSTAVPLTDTIPNNDSGYGRVDAYAAVALAARAGLISGTVYGGSVPIPGATIQATPAISGLEGTTTSDSEGHYQLFLGAGNYDVFASAFGYVSAGAPALPVVTGSVTVQNFNLTALPTGRVQGTVSGVGGGGLEATVRALNTPVKAIATGGSYNFDLPAGRYTLEARILGYRVVTASVTVSAGQNTQHDFVLPESMRLLLVDGGSRYYGSQASYYRQALDDLSYSFGEAQLKYLPDDLPILTELLSYDLVIWSAPNDSPGLVGAGSVITDYLDTGGSLLLSGQDVAFWDAGGIWYIENYYINFVHSIYQDDDAPSRQVVCLDDSAFGGMTLTIQGGDGADNQTWPDEINVYHPDHASLACSYEGGEGAVIKAGFCNSHRALNLGFGFEAISDASDRAQFMAHALDWFASPRVTSGVELLRQSDPSQIAPPGGVVTHTFRLRNLGETGMGDLFNIQVTDAEWSTTVLTRSVELSPCATAAVGLRVEVPADATWNDFDVMTLTARSSFSPTLSETLVITSKTPAPVLLVDDDRWYDQEQAYESALQASALPYDRWDVTGLFGSGSPPPQVLDWYPIVLWFTGYDWFDPLAPSELDRLAKYLDTGGRLFLSSQFALWDIYSSAFALDYFGVISYSGTLSQTVVQGVPAHVLGDGMGPIDLAYPFNNWSVSVLPIPGTQVAFRGQHGQPGAVTREGACGALSSTCRWRTALFAFPVEALPEAPRAELMSRLVGWMSWLGGSGLYADRRVAQVGDTVSYTLVLSNDGPATIFGGAVSNTLPVSTTLVGGPGGGASYDPQNRRITWTGDLAPGAAVRFTYQLRLTDGGASIPLHNLADFVLGEQGLHFLRQADVTIAAPDLSDSTLTMSPENAAQTPATAKASTEVAVTLVGRNNGLADAPNASVDNPLPWPLRLITGTLSSHGVGTATERPQENRVAWQGEIAAGASITLTYRAIAPPVLDAATWLYNAARLETSLGGAWERGAWLTVEPHWQYFPIFFKDG
jgi:uncharacterized repeat protein (TIGR01451 family)